MPKSKKPPRRPHIPHLPAPCDPPEVAARKIVAAVDRVCSRPLPQEILRTAVYRKMARIQWWCTEATPATLARIIQRWGFLALDMVANYRRIRAIVLEELYRQQHPGAETIPPRLEAHLRRPRADYRALLRQLRRDLGGTEEGGRVQ